MMQETISQPFAVRTPNRAAYLGRVATVIAAAGGITPSAVRACGDRARTAAIPSCNILLFTD
jgi:hypothetical protein